MRSSLLLALPLALSLVITAPAQARWAKPDEAPYAVDFERNFLNVHADGTYEMTTERQVEILKDSARTNVGITRMTFDAHSGELKVLEARTINPEGTVKVDSKYIEIKPLASSGPGFDEQRQLTVAFPEVKVGSKLYLKTVHTETKPLIPGYFSSIWTIGWGELVRENRFEITSEQKLHTAVLDTDHYFKVETHDDSPTKHRIVFELTKPIYLDIVQEHNVHPNARSYPWLAVSSISKWSEFPPKVIDAYEKDIASPLPALLQGIYDKAKSITDETAQINLVTSRIQDAIRYVGDWVPVEGANFPRPLDVIARSQFGDCKDFTTVTAAVLKRLGYDVHAAWITRGIAPVIMPLDLPATYFNHAIVHAEKNGHEHWIDPTNSSSFAQGTYPDISDRPALVLFPAPRVPQLLRTPALDPKGSTIDVSYKLDFGPDNMIDAEGAFNLERRATLWMAGAALSYSKDQLDYWLLGWFTNVDHLESWKLADYDVTSRIAHDLKIPLHFREHWRPVQTSLGLGYLVPAPLSTGNFQVRRNDRVSDLAFDDPGVWRREIRFGGRDFLLQGERGCRIHSEWTDFSRNFRRDPRNGGEIVLVDELVIKKPLATVQELRSPAFAEMQDQMNRCSQEAVVIAREGSKAKARAVARRREPAP